MKYKTLKTILSCVVLWFLLAGCSNPNLDNMSLVSENLLEGTDISSRNLFLNIDLGSVSINTWDNDSVKVNFFATSQAINKYNFITDNTDKGVNVVISQSFSGVYILNVAAEIFIEITIPKSFSVTALLNGGNLEVSDLNGDITAQTYGGSISGINITGNITAESGGGSANIDINDGEVNIATQGGGVSCNYSGVNKGIDLNSAGGKIKLNLPENIDAKIDLIASGGGINIEGFTLNNATYLEERITGNMNNSGLDIKCSSGGGDIMIYKK